MNFVEATNQLKNGNISPVYYLVGDAFFIDKTVQDFKSILNIADMSFTYFNDENFDARQVICACEQFSFFGDKRLVVVSDISKELNQDAKQLFLNYTKNPNVNCVLIIKNSLNAKTFDFLTDLIKVECKATDAYYTEYILNFFKENNILTSDACAKKILLYCLGDFTRINNELNKLKAYLVGKNELTENVIDDLVYKDTELKVFDLTTALSSKNIKKAQEVLSLMFSSDEPPTKILALVYSHFRRLFFVKLNKDRTNAELAKLLNVKEFAITKAKEQAKNIPIIKLKQIDELCLEVDYMIKAGKMAQDNAIYYLIYKINSILCN